MKPVLVVLKLFLPMAPFDSYFTQLDLFSRLMFKKSYGNYLYWESFLRWGFLIWVLILLQTFVLILVVFFCFSHYVSAKFHLWPSSGD